MEVWKDVIGYKGYYMVSNLGNVKSLVRKKWNGKTFNTIKGKILKQSTNNVGYKVVNLSVNGKKKVILVHRIVAEAFIPNKENLPLINHKDGNKKNNNIDNLEWSTYKDNNSHAIENGLNKVKKSVKGINIKTGEILFFESAREAYRQTGVNYKYISDCLCGRQKTAGGFRWELSN